MNNETDHDYFRCTPMRESAKAYLVKLHHNNVEHWVPMSLCELKRNGNEITLEVEAWFAKSEGMAE